MKRLGGATREAAEQVFLQSGGAPLGVKEAALKLGRSEAEVEAVVRELAAEGRLVPVSGEAPETFLNRSVYDGFRKDVEADVRKYFEGHPGRPFMPYSELRAGFLKRGDAQTLKLIVDDLCRVGVLVRKDVQVGLVGHEARMKPADQLLADRIEGFFRASRFSAPLEDEVQRKLALTPSRFKSALDALIREGKIVRLAPKVTYHREAVDAAKEAVLGLIERHASVTIAELRDRLGLSRKYAQAILEFFDKTGLTKRVEDRHVLNKRM